MTRAPRKALTIGMELLACASIGLMSGATIGALFVLVSWFPFATVAHLQDPHLVDPRLSLPAWSAGYAIVVGLVGSVVGATIRALIVFGPGAGEPSPKTG